MALVMTGAQWKAFMADPKSWPDDETHIEEYLLDVNGVETEDLADEAVRDGDRIVIHSGWVRFPEPGSSILAHVEFEEWAKEFLKRHRFVHVPARPSKGRLAEFLAEAKAGGFKAVAFPAVPATGKVRLTGADWAAYIALQPPEWPEEGYIVDCTGSVNAQASDPSENPVAPNAVVTVTGGCIVVDRTGDEFDLREHLVQWMEAIPTIGVLVEGKRERADALEALVERYAAAVPGPADAISPSL